MSKKKVLFNLEEEMDDRLKKVSKNLRVSKSDIVRTLLERFIPELEAKEIDSLPSVLLFDTDKKSFNGVGSLFHGEK